MKLLGAILAGGASRRFGADKARAEVDGIALLDHVAAALGPQCDALVVTGRDWPGLRRIDDRPGPGLGPIGGLHAALLEASAGAFDAVLLAPCDCLGIPADLALRLAPGPAVADGQWLVGLWPPATATLVADHLVAGGPRSMRALAAAAGARLVPIPGLRNVNRPEDLG